MAMADNDLFICNRVVERVLREDCLQTYGMRKSSERPGFQELIACQKVSVQCFGLLHACVLHCILRNEHG